ncbi:MAG: hypothetical protein H6581_02395 [Bacteroidia bacterium]|nr:hypothetical protein [Bacteroidia bacterium]
MKRLLLCFLFAGLICPAIAQYNAENLKVGFSAFSKELTFGNLRIYPIVANDNFFAANKGVGKYVTLENALEKQNVSITERSGDLLNANEDWQVQEVGGGAQVNSLMIENTSNDTVFIMAGELIKGGKQDRVIAQDLKIPPKSGKVDLSVFCVEHGRWSYGDTEEKFNGYGKVSSLNVRKAAVQEKDQQAVWDSVANITAKNGASSHTGTYNELEKSRKLQVDLDKYVSHFTHLPYDGKEVVGMVGVTGDRIIGCDIFATHDLFQSQFNNLLHAYATEAITNGESVTLQPKVVDDYLAELLDESKQDAFIDAKGARLKEADKTLHINTYD